MLNPSVRETLRAFGVEGRTWGRVVVLRIGAIERTLVNPRDAEILRAGYGLRVEWESWRGPVLAPADFKGV